MGDTLQERARQWRKDHHLTQEDMAEELCVSWRTYVRFEMSRGEPVGSPWVDKLTRLINDDPITLPALDPPWADLHPIETLTDEHARLCTKRVQLVHLVEKAMAEITKVDQQILKMRYENRNPS